MAQKRGASQGEIGLPETYRRGIEAALPRGMTVNSDFWDALWGIHVRYQLAEQNRKCNPPTARTKEWQRFEKRLVQFKGDMIAVRRTIDRRLIDPENQPPPWWINLLGAVQTPNGGQVNTVRVIRRQVPDSAAKVIHKEIGSTAKS